MDTLIQTYNNSYHRSIKTLPSKVKKKNEKTIHQILKKKDSRDKVFNFEVGQTVRIRKYKHIFEKWYTPKWTDEIFKVKYQIPRDPVVYKIEDLNKKSKVFFMNLKRKMSFYITLPSNLSLADFPENTLTNFTTRLKNPRRLDGPYEVALAQVLFPKNWT